MVGHPDQVPTGTCVNEQRHETADVSHNRVGGEEQAVSNDFEAQLEGHGQHEHTVASLMGNNHGSQFLVTVINY